MFGFGLNKLKREVRNLRTLVGNADYTKPNAHLNLRARVERLEELVKPPTRRADISDTDKTDTK